MEGHRMMMEGQMQVPVAAQPPDQPGLLSASQIPPSASQRMQVKAHPPVMGGGVYGQHEGLAYCPPMDYMQRHHPTQPCHTVGKPYYGQAPYHGQQMLLNPHVSPPAAQHQPLYFRPGRGGSAGAYPKVHGSSHGWGDYRVKLDQMQMYGPNQQYANPTLYVNPATVDPRIPEFNSPMGVPAALEGQRFGSPTHGYHSGPGYYGGGQPVQQYPPYMVPGKPWHSGAEHGGMQRAVVVDPQYKVVHPVNNVVETNFPRHPAALSPAAAGASKLPQNYIPGKRLEHFSPAMQGCGGGPVMMSPSRQNPECLEEFPGAKTPMAIHGPGHPAEFPNRQCVVYGPMLSPGSQYRPGATPRNVDVSGLHPGVYGSNVYGPQGFIDGPTPLRCNYSHPKQMQSPHFYPYVGAKCESEGVGQFFGGQEPTVGGTSLAVSANVGQNQICRDTMAAENAGCTASHLHPGLSAVMTGCDATATFTSAVKRRSGDHLSPSLERTTSVGSGARIDEQRRLSALQTSSVPAAGCLYSSSSNTEMGLVKSSPVSSTPANLSGGCSASQALASLGNKIETVVCSDNLQPSTFALARTDVGRGPASVALTSATKPSPLSNYRVLCPARTSLDTSCAVVTQTVSTSTTVAMTVSTAASASRHCSLVTAAVEVSVSPSGKEVSSSNPCYRGESRTWASGVSSDKNIDFKEFSNAFTLLPPVRSSVPASPSESRDAGVHLVKTEPMFASPHCRVPRAKKKKVKLKAVVEFPKPEGGLTSIKLEEPGEVACESRVFEEANCRDAPSLFAAKPGLHGATKELCLDDSARMNRDLPLPKDPSPGNPAPCLGKAEVGDVKDHAVKPLVTVPFGWKRLKKDGRVVYHSPTDVELDSLDQIRQYLLQEGTCKCGLQCPLVAEKVFVFDPAVQSRHLCADDVRCDMDMTNLCNHKRKIVAMATFQASAGLQMNLIDGMQFRDAPLRSASAGFEGRTEFGPAVCQSSDTLAGKFSHAGSESLATSNQKIQQGCFPGNTSAAFGRKTGRADGQSVDKDNFCAMESNKWPMMLSPGGGAAHSTKAAPMVEGAGIPGNSPYLPRNCGPQAPAPHGSTVEHQHLELSMTSPRHGNPNQHPGGFPMEPSGFRVMQNMGPAQHVPSGYGPSRPMWPPYDETRFPSSQYGRPGMYGPQSKFRGGGEMMWPFRQNPAHGGRVGPPHMAQPFGGYAMMPEEQGELSGGRNYDMESHATLGLMSSDLWGQSSTPVVASGAKSVRKTRKKASKKEKPYSSILEKSMPCPNIDVRQIIQEQQERIQVEASANHGCQLPAGPGGGTDHLTTFLAQQTVLVNRSLPGNLGCASPADDSDATQSVSTIYGSVDDSCQTLSGSSPLVDNSSVSFSVTPSMLCQTEKKEEEAKARTYSSSADTSVDSASRSSVFSNCQQIATENISPGPDHCAVLASPGGGEPGFSEQQPSTTTCLVASGRGFAQSAPESMFGSVDRSVVASSFCSPSSDQSAVHPGMPSFQLRPTLTSGLATLSSIASVSDMGILTHQPPMFSFNSNSSQSGFPSNWSSSNPVHSRNQFYFPPRNNVAPYSGAVAGGTNRNVLPSPEMSSRSEQYVAHLASGIDVAPDCHAVMKPAPSGLSSAGGSQATEPFAHVPFDVAAAGGMPTLQRCPATSQESRFLEDPGPGCPVVEQSPITLVQNMVSGLVTTQNTLAMVTSMIISRSDTSRRRRSGTYSDPTARKSIPQCAASVAVAAVSSVCTDIAASLGGSSESQTLTVASSSPLRAELSCSRNPTYVDTLGQANSASTPSIAEASVVSGLHGISQEQQVAMASATAVTTVTQAVPTAGIQPSFGPIVQVLNPVNITLPGTTSILLNDQVNVLAFGGQDPAILQQGLTMPGVGQLHIAHHQPQGQMVVFPTGQGTAMVAIQPSQSALVTDFAVEDAGRAGGGGVLMEEEEAGGGAVEEGDEGEQMEADEMMRTTGTQTSTPASSFSNCNSLDSGENEMEVTEVICPDQSVSSSTREDAGVPATKDGPGIRRAARKAAQPTMASILQQQQQGPMSTAQVVMMPSVQQQPFVLPQGVAFAGALGGQGYLQLQQPVDFGFSPNQVGLIHFGQITAAGGLIPTTALVGAMSVAGGGVVSALDRVMAPDLPVCTPNQPAKSDPSPGQAFGTAEILHLMSPSMPHGPILVQNMQTFAPFAGTLLPVMTPQAALGTAICNIGGAQTIFAVSQGSLGIVTTVASALQHATPDRMFGDAMPEAPDSTVDSEDAISSNVVDSDSVVTSTDSHRTTFVSTEASRDRPRSTLCQTRPSSATVDAVAEEARDVKDEGSETPKESPEFTRETESRSPTAVQQQVPDDGMSRESDGSTQNSKDSPLVQAGPSSFGFTGEQLKSTAPMKLVRHRKTKRMRRKRHLPSFSSRSSSVLLAPSEPELQDTAKMSNDFEKRIEKGASPGSSTGVESGDCAIASSKREAESNKDDLSTDVLSKSGSSMQGSFSAASSAECHVTTSLTCDSGDSSTCNTEKPSYNRASRLRTKIERARSEHLSFPKGRHAFKRARDDEISKERRVTDDADSTTSLPSISYPRSFNVGDLVWGPARGFPSWPGKLVPETEVRGNPKTENGKIWVKWFGDHTFTQAEPDQLKTLSEGLETHHNARKKHRKGRRMNANLEAAIQEAMVELDRQMAEQSKQTFGSSTPSSDKGTPPKQWSSKRTKK